MVLCDLHFHANVRESFCSRHRRRLQRAASCFDEHNLDYVASTEHAYKNPLNAYLRLREATSHIATHIIPGVEEVSSEGIDAIFLFKDEAALRHGLGSIRTFFWSIDDIARIGKDLGAITIIPHPFHIGQTGAGQVLSLTQYMALLDDVDYIEIHNGSALNIRHRIHRSKTTPLFARTQHHLDLTLDLPLHLRGGKATGWSVGSDAHYPSEQYIVGSTDMAPASGQHFFDILRRRVHFSPHPLKPVGPRVHTNCFSIARDLQSILREGTTKRYKKTITKVQRIANL